MNSLGPATDEAISEGASASEVKFVAQLINSVQLTSVQLVSFNGSLLFDVALPYQKIQVESSPFQYRIRDNKHLDYKFDFDVKMLGSEDHAIAGLSLTFVATFEWNVTEPGLIWDENTIRLFGESNVLFMVYPYIREAVQNFTQRLGLQPAVLDILQRDSKSPQNLDLLPVQADSIPTAENL